MEFTIPGGGVAVGGGVAGDRIEGGGVAGGVNVEGFAEKGEAG